MAGEFEGRKPDLLELLGLLDDPVGNAKAILSIQGESGWSREYVQANWEMLVMLGLDTLRSRQHELNTAEQFKGYTQLQGVLGDLVGAASIALMRQQEQVVSIDPVYLSSPTSGSLPGITRKGKHKITYQK